VAARACEADVEALAADGAIGDVDAEPVHRDEIVHLALVFAGQEVPDATQVPGALFTHVADEDDPSGGPHAAFVERSRDGEHDGEPAAVVADSRGVKSVAALCDLDAGALGKNRVEVPRDHHGGACPGPRALHHDVADGVDAGVCISKRRQSLPELGTANLFLETGGGNLAQRNLLVESPGVERLYVIHPAADCRVVGRDAALSVGHEGKAERGKKTDGYGIPDSECQTVVGAVRVGRTVHIRFP
jgi:hypothetical protein